MKKKYKVTIDVSPLSDGNSQRGVGFYTTRLVESLKKVTLTNPNYNNFSISLAKDEVPKNSNLVHYPFFDIFASTLPTKKYPTVVTVHDLIPLDLASHYPVGLKGLFRWQLQKHRLKKADFIITDSIYSKFSIEKHTNYPLDHIFCIYLAADTIFKPMRNLKRKNYVLYTGDINYNKNVPALAKVCVKNNFPLIIVGKTAAQTDIPTHPWTESLRELKSIQKMHPHLIKTVGFVDSKDLNIYFNQARLYCQPSLAEGFGLPLLEAMQTGCPVVYSNKSSLAEIGNNVGLQFDPSNFKEMDRQIVSMWNNPELRAKSAKDGKAQAKLFSWEDTAIQTLEVYKLALAKL